jgi:hypothetical protein
MLGQTMQALSGIGQPRHRPSDDGVEAPETPGVPRRSQ